MPIPLERHITNVLNWKKINNTLSYFGREICGTNNEIVLTLLTYILICEVSHSLWLPQVLFFPPLQLQFPRSFSRAFNLSLSICLRFSRVPSYVNHGFTLGVMVPKYIHVSYVCIFNCFVYVFFLSRSLWSLLQTPTCFPCVSPYVDPSIRSSHFLQGFPPTFLCFHFGFPINFLVYYTVRSGLRIV